MTILAALPERYRTILCDLWGCIHDGYQLLPGALERLEQWRSEGRSVVFVTNAPRSAEAVRGQLDRLGIARTLYAGITTAGDVGADALAGRPVGFSGSPADREDLERRGLVFVDSGYDEVAMSGPTRNETAEQYSGQLAEWREQGVLLHCLNPDRVVIHGSERIVCAGAIADAYEAMGGEVCWYGKPHAATYDHALRQVGSPPRDQVLAIGDGLQTDVLGAADYGIDCVFVAGGIHAGEPYPDDLRPGWKPIAVVSSLA